MMTVQSLKVTFQLKCIYTLNISEKFQLFVQYCGKSIAMRKLKTDTSTLKPLNVIEN